MIFYKLCSVLIILILASVILIYADTNGNTNNNLNTLNSQTMNGNLMNGNTMNTFLEEDNVAECTRCGESRLVGCLRGEFADKFYVIN